MKRGASVDAIASYKADALKTTLSFFRVSGRSRLTYKEDMAKRLIEVFGGDEDKHGKASRGEEEKVMRRQENDNMILRSIKVEENNADDYYKAALEGRKELVHMNKSNGSYQETTMDDYRQSIKDSTSLKYLPNNTLDQAGRKHKYSRDRIK